MNLSIAKDQLISRFAVCAERRQHAEYPAYPVQCSAPSWGQPPGVHRHRPGRQRDVLGGGQRQEKGSQHHTREKDCSASYASWPSPEIEMEVDEKNTCSLRAGASFYKLKGMSADEFSAHSHAQQREEAHPSAREVQRHAAQDFLCHLGR